MKFTIRKRNFRNKCQKVSKVLKFFRKLTNFQYKFYYDQKEKEQKPPLKRVSIPCLSIPIVGQGPTHFWFPWRRRYSKCPKGLKEQNSVVQDTPKQKRIDADIARCEGKRSKYMTASGKISGDTSRYRSPFGRLNQYEKIRALGLGCPDHVFCHRVSC